MFPVDLTEGQVRLREFRADDVDALHRVYGSPAATQHLSFEPRVRDDVELLLKRIAVDALALPRSEYALAVQLCAGDDMIGMARLALGDFRSGQIGFALRPDRWRQGLGTDAVRALLRLGFAELGLHRVWGARSPLNEGSARLMTGLGMTVEGRIRDHVFVRGAWRDSIVHSILEHEWRPTP
jgi:ribosomal-protein-alanine N-acetyltransferase